MFPNCLLFGASKSWTCIPTSFGSLCWFSPGSVVPALVRGGCPKAMVPPGCSSSQLCGLDFSMDVHGLSRL